MGERSLDAGLGVCCKRRIRASGGSGGDLADALKLLRRWASEMLRIAWRDIVAAASVRETLRDVSILADACIRPPRGRRARNWRYVRVPRTAAGAEAELVVLGWASSVAAS